MTCLETKDRRTHTDSTVWENQPHAGHNDSSSARAVAQASIGTGLSPRSNQRYHTPTGARCSSVAETLAAWHRLARYADESHHEQSLPWRQRRSLDGHRPSERLCGPALDDLPTSLRTRLAGASGRKGHADRVLGSQVRSRPNPATPPRWP